MLIFRIWEIGTRSWRMTSAISFLTCWPSSLPQTELLTRTWWRGSCRRFRFPRQDASTASRSWWRTYTARCTASWSTPTSRTGRRGTGSSTPSRPSRPSRRRPSGLWGGSTPTRPPTLRGSSPSLQLRGFSSPAASRPFSGWRSEAWCRVSPSATNWSPGTRGFTLTSPAWCTATWSTSRPRRGFTRSSETPWISSASSSLRLCQSV